MTCFCHREAPSLLAAAATAIMPSRVFLWLQTPFCSKGTCSPTTGPREMVAPLRLVTLAGPRQGYPRPLATTSMGRLDHSRMFKHHILWCP